MNFDNLISIAVSVVIGAAAIGKLDALQDRIWRAQAKVVYESRASAWGSPRFFNEKTYSKQFTERRTRKEVQKNHNQGGHI
jgi:hypothetical protein